MTKPTLDEIREQLARITHYIRTLEKYVTTLQNDLPQLRQKLTAQHREIESLKTHQGNAIQHRLAQLTNKVLAIEQDITPDLNRRLARIEPKVLSPAELNGYGPTKTGPAE